MLSLRILSNVPKPRSLSSLRSISSLQRPSNVLSRGWEDETRDLIGDPNRNINPNPNFRFPEAERSPNTSISTFYDPMLGDIVTKPNEEVPKSNDVERLEKAWKDASRDLFGPDQNPEPERSPNTSISTFYDPILGDIVTKPNEEVPKSNDVERLEKAWKDASRDLFGPDQTTETNLWNGEIEDNPIHGIVSIPEPLVSKATEEEPKAKGNIRFPAVGKRRAGKNRVSWVCESCGATMGQWWGRCPTCHLVGTVKQFLEGEVSKARGAEISEAAVRSWLPQNAGELVPQSLKEVNKGRKQSEWRIPLSGHFGMEVARVLGGGLVPGSLVLVGGDPGVGKSTLLLQLAAIIADGCKFNGPAPVIYVSGEESIEQIWNRADRMRITTANLFLYSSTDIEDILDKIQALTPQAVIIDSIQTVYLKGVAGSAGNVVQVKECTSALLRFAKQTNIPVLLIGHVTKSGDIAGPRILEHIVDVVLYLEGERYSSYRLLRSVKNRFGSADELGVFEMSESGLEAVSNPSEMFLTDHYPDSEILAGLAVAVVVDGSRTFLIEIQALCISGSSVSRHLNGVRESRADMIIAVLMKQVGLKLQDSAVFLNVVSGFKLTETAGDLAVAAAICSSFLEFPIPNDVAFIGEIGLGGELQMVPRMDKRVMAVAKLGYKRCVIPKAAEKSLRSLHMSIDIVGCRTLKEMINTIFREG